MLSPSSSHSHTCSHCFPEIFPHHSWILPRSFPHLSQIIPSFAPCAHTVFPTFSHAFPRSFPVLPPVPQFFPAFSLSFPRSFPTSSHGFPRSFPVLSAPPLFFYPCFSKLLPMVSQIVFRFGYMSSLEPDSCGQKKTSRFLIVSLEILKFFQLIL